MSWTSIDQDKCTACGNCVAVCTRSYSMENKVVKANANEITCNLCGRCVSVCPAQAITHNKMDMSNFLPVDETATPDTDKFIAFLRKRRSYRHFLKKEVTREALQTLLEACRYAPTGSNMQSVEALVIRDRDRLDRLTRMAVDANQEIVAKLEAQAATFRAEGKELPPALAYSLMRSAMRKRQVIALQMGRDPIFHHAPVVIIFHAPTNVSTPHDDCVIAAQTMTLTAETMGLGTCYIGLFQVVANSYGPLVEDLKLPEANKIYSVLVMGWPKFKFLTTVDRKPIATRWE